MKTMNIPRGTARAKRRNGNEMTPPSADALSQMAAHWAYMNRKMATALFFKHGKAKLPF